jgi:D-glycero-D-manno-heptose 1,7-bisphosphate phosphatase
MPKKYKLVILDRDGVINEDSDEYIKSPEEFHLIPGSLAAIAKLNQAKIKVAIVSNQSGIARGYYTEETLQKIHQKMHTELTKVGGHIDKVYYCPHHPDEDCLCRKPKPKLLLEAMQYFQAKPEATIFIGDKWIDLETASNANCDFILVKTGKGLKTIQQNTAKLKNCEIFNDLQAAIASILF